MLCLPHQSQTFPFAAASSATAATTIYHTRLSLRGDRRRSRSARRLISVTRVICCFCVRQCNSSSTCSHCHCCRPRCGDSGVAFCMRMPQKRKRAAIVNIARSSKEGVASIPILGGTILFLLLLLGCSDSSVAAVLLLHRRRRRGNCSFCPRRLHMPERRRHHDNNYLLDDERECTANRDMHPRR